MNTSKKLYNLLSPVCSENYKEFTGLARPVIARLKKGRSCSLSILIPLKKAASRPNIYIFERFTLTAAGIMKFECFAELRLYQDLTCLESIKLNMGVKK